MLGERVSTTGIAENTVADLLESTSQLIKCGALAGQASSCSARGCQGTSIVFCAHQSRRSSSSCRTRQVYFRQLPAAAARSSTARCHGRPPQQKVDLGASCNRQQR